MRGETENNQIMPEHKLTTISVEEFEELLESIVRDQRPRDIVLQPVLLVVRTTEANRTMWIGEGSVLATGIFPDQTIEVVGYKLRSVDPANVAEENRRFIDMLEILLDRTGVRKDPGLTVTIREVRNPI